MRLRLVATGLAICALVPVLVWKSEYPQRFAVERAVHQILGAHASARGIGVSPEFSIERLLIYPDAKSRDSGASFAELEGVRVEYSLSSDRGRNVSLVHIDRLRIYPDAANPEETNFQFLLDFFSEEVTDESVRWIPERIEIDRIELAGGWEEARGKIGGLKLSVDIRSRDDLDLVLEGRGLVGGISGRILDAELDGLEFEDGRCEVSVLVRGEVIEIEFSHEIPDVYRVDVKGMVTEEDGHRIIDARDGRVGVYSDGFAGLLKPFIGGLDVVIDVAELEMPEFRWDSETGGLPTGDVHGYVRGLSVNDETSLLYEGDVEWAGTLSGGEEARSVIRVGLSQGLDFDMRFASNDGERSLGVEFSRWEKSAMLRAIPADLGGGLEDLPFDQIRGKGEVKWGETSFVIDGEIRSVSEEDADPIDVMVSLSGEFENLAETVGEIDVRIGKGIIRARGARDDDGVYSARADFERVQLKLLVLLATGNRLPERFSGYVDGTVGAEREADSQEILFSLRFLLSELVYGEIGIDTIGFGGEIAMDREARTVEIRDFLIEAVDETLRIEMAEVDLDLDSGDLNGAFVYSGDIGLAMRLAGLEGFSGTVEGAGSLDIVDGRYTMPFTFVSVDVEYNDILLPYETVLEGDGAIYLDDATSVWRAEKIVARAGEGSVFRVVHAVADAEGMRAETRFSSDLKLGIEMGYYEDISGSVEGGAKWNWPRDGEMAVEWELAGVVEDVVLKEKTGTVSGFRLSATGDYAGELHGEGEFSAVNITVAGARINSLSGIIGFADNVMVIPDATAEVFDGELVSRIEVRVLEEGLPLAYAGRLEGIDLAVLSEEVQPPKTKLTGIANGTIAAEYDFAMGLTDFDLDVSSNTNFSINRSLVEEMMQMQAVLGGLAAKKAEKTIAKFLGKAEQRPFETARMNVYLLDDVILGVTEMRSQKTKEYNGLNLTIQLDIDKSALVASLKLLEESNVANVSF